MSVLILVVALTLTAAQADERPAVRREAATAFREGRFAAAEDALRRLLKLSPEDPATLGFLGAVLDAREKYDEAERCYEEALRKPPPSSALLNNLGNHFMAREQPEKARPWFERLLAQDPASENASLQLARIAAGQRQGGKALEYLARVRSTDPAVVLLRAEALHWAGKHGEALALLEEVGRNAGSDPRVQFSLGAAFARMELYERAEAAFSAVLAGRPGEFDVLFNLGRAAARARHDDRALRAFETALKLRPDDVETLFELARVYLAREDYDGAVYLLAKARKAAPRHAGVLLALARAAEGAGYYGDSASTYDEYLQLRPEDDEARRDRALVYAYTGTRIEDGLRELNEYVKTHPRDPLGYYYLAQFSALTNTEKALEEVGTALRLDPNSGPARYTRAFLLHKLGRTAESLPDLEAALQSSPNDFRILDQLGLAYLTLEKPDEAEKVLRRAVALAPEEPEILMHLGRALMDLGREEEAQRYLEQFQKNKQEKTRPPRQNPGVIEFAGMPASEQRQRLVRDLSNWVRTRPNDPDLRLRLGKVLLSLGRSDEAAGVFRELLSLNPDGGICQDAGAALLRSGQYAPARDFLRRAAEERPQARMDLAIAVFFAEGPGPALDVLAGVPEREQSGDYLLLKARILDASGRASEAERVLTEGLVRATTRPLVARQAVLLLLQHKRTEEALALLDRALPSSPDNADLLLTKAIVLGLMNRNSDSEKMLKQVESRWPEWDRPYVAHGLLLERLGRPDQARQKTRTAVLLGSADLVARCKGLYELLFPACVP